MAGSVNPSPPDPGPPGIKLPISLRLLLERNGFELKHLYGDYDGSELSADSPRMISCSTPR